MVTSDPPRVGFVATGSELINGDILNTNSQYFCEQLIKQGMIPGQQVIVGDNEAEIQQAIKYLLPTHRAIITIGGLGPTVDDRTRIGLAHTLHLPLAFYPEAWDWVVRKILSLGYDHVPENNRQQAYFPKGATLLENKEGTAAGCYLHQQEHDFFMLPGPPNEAHPIFDHAVMPLLQKQGYATTLYRKSWLLLGVSEGEMASKLEPLLQPDAPVDLGFRVNYPYLEVKLVSPQKNALEAISQQCVALFGDAIVSEKQQPATQQLREWLLENKISLRIEDHATHGALLHHLLTPETYPWLLHATAMVSITLQGLEAYWLKQTHLTSLPMTINIVQSQQPTHFIVDIPIRGARTIASAVERISWQLLCYLKKSAV